MLAKNLLVIISSYIPILQEYQKSEEHASALSICGRIDRNNNWVRQPKVDFRKHLHDDEHEFNSLVHYRIQMDSACGIHGMDVCGS